MKSRMRRRPTSSSSTMRSRPARSATSRSSPAARARSQRPHPRHLRAARAQLRRQARSGARAAEAHRQPPGARLDAPRAPGRAASACAVRARRSSRRDRRLLGQRVQRAHQAPGEDPAAARDRARSTRAEIPVPSLALVGYTNAGKSTLFRALTGADAYVADQLFATLDPTVRRTAAAGRHAGGGRRHRGLHPRSAARAGGGVPVHADRGARGDAAAARRRCQRSAPRRAHRRRSTRVLEEIGAEQHSAAPGLQQDRPPRGRAAHRARRRRPRARGVDLRRSSGMGLDLLRHGDRRAPARALPGGRGCACRRAPARCARGCTRAGAVRGETSADDGSIELAVELPDVELLALARTPGVQILEVPERGHALCPRGRLPTIVRRSERRQASAESRISLLWPGINLAVRTTPGAGVPTAGRSGPRRARERLAAQARVAASRSGGGRAASGGAAARIFRAAVHRWRCGSAAASSRSSRRARRHPALRQARATVQPEGCGLALAVADRDASPR